MKRVYIVIDGETDTILTVGFSKANVLEELFQIDALTTEAERLFTKRDRLEQHAINLNAKARKLEEVLETIKEFE